MRSLASTSLLTRRTIKTGRVYVLIRAFTVLALGRPGGRAAPYIEHELWQRLRRVERALHDRRDPNAAYETPLDDEQPLSADDQFDAMASPMGREMARMLWTKWIVN